MTQQLLFLLFLFAAGAGVQLRLTSRMSAAFAATTALPLGLLLWVTLIVASLLARVPLHFGALIAVITMLAAAGFVTSWRAGRRPTRADGAAFSAMLAVYCIAGFNAGRNDYSVLSPDSFTITSLGRLLAERGTFHWSMSGIFPDWGVYTIAGQAASHWLGVDFFWLLQPFLAVSVAAMLVVAIYLELTGSRGMGRVGAGAVAVLSGCFLVSSPFFVFNAVFIHNAMPATLYLTLALVAFRPVDDVENPPGLGLAWCGLWGLILSRPEGAIVAGVIGVACLASFPYDKRHALKISGGCLLATALWYVQLALWTDGSSQIMNPLNATLTVIPLVGVFAAVLLTNTKLEGLRRWSPVVMTVCLAGGLCVAFVVNYGMVRSLRWMTLNLFFTGRWGFSSVTLAAAFAAALIAGGRISRERALLCSIVTYAMLVLFMGTMRHPYRHGWGDTANRMLLHIFPAMILYVAVKLGPYLSGFSPGSRASRDTSLTVK